MYIRRNSSRLGRYERQKFGGLGRHPARIPVQSAAHEQGEPELPPSIGVDLPPKNKLSWVVGAGVLAGIAWLVTRPLPQKGSSTTYTFSE